MSMRDRDTARPRQQGVDRVGRESSEPEEKRGHGRWMMIACCIPMIAIAIILVATGFAGAGFILVAVACTAMMAIMMVGMR